MKKTDALDRSICPLCFRLYPSSLARSEWPMCADCSSEAIDMDVIPLRRYLADNSLRELTELRDSWAASDEFLPAYKAEKLKRISYVLELKRRLGPTRKRASRKKGP
jgi:hypothetical protein